MEAVIFEIRANGKRTHTNNAQDTTFDKTKIKKMQSERIGPNSVPREHMQATDKDGNLKGRMEATKHEAGPQPKG